MAPFNAWLLLRGLMTLPARMQRHHDDALVLATYLKGHSRISKVLHPAFEEGDLMNRQMRGHSGLFSVCVDVADFGELLKIANRGSGDARADEFAALLRRARRNR